MTASRIIEYRGYIIHTDLQEEDNGQWTCSVTIFDRLSKVIGMGGPSLIEANSSSALAEELAIEAAKELVDAELVVDGEFKTKQSPDPSVRNLPQPYQL